jgi:hypothetical protein
MQYSATSAVLRSAAAAVQDSSSRSSRTLPSFSIEHLQKAKGTMAAG